MNSKNQHSNCKSSGVKTLFQYLLLAVLFFSFPVFQSCNSNVRESSDKGLAVYYENYFPVGVAVSPRSLVPPVSDFIISQFNSVTPENSMKMGPIHPEENRFNWKPADEIVDFAISHGMKIRGHAPVWHEQAPGWIFMDNGDTVTKDILLLRMKNHIDSVFTRYKGKIYCYDVVNEAIADDSSIILRESPWFTICGEEFIEKAFLYAHEADPNAKLFYNDYNLTRPEKTERTYQMLKKLIDKGIPIDGVGLQGHWSIIEPSEQELRNAITRFASLGLEIQVTELDISIYNWEKNVRSRRQDENDEFTASLEQKQIEQYKMIFQVLREFKDNISGVTFWGISDGRTWLNHYPVEGRRNYPLLFDADLKPKKVFREVVNL